MVNYYVYKTTIFFISLYKSIEMLWIRLFPNFYEGMLCDVLKSGGIDINGDKPWDIQVKNKEFYPRVVNQGNMGFGEGYMDGLWDAEDIEEISCRFFKNGIYLWYLNPWNRFLDFMEGGFFNLQSQQHSWEVGEKHYDTGNDLFESFLDPSMNYSCGYWKSAKNLAEAQIAKMELIAQKLMLKPGMKVLDIGCGWGGLCYHLAKNYGVSVVGITISKEQAALAQQRCEGFPVEIKLVDYRDLKEQFDRIVSVGMFEHVGHKNYREYFETAHRCLKDDGLFLLQAIGTNHKELPCTEPWYHRYIFPNGMFPRAKHLTNCTEGLFIIEDLHNFGNDYTKTLQAWIVNFKKNWPTIEGKYGPRFYRMWNYYLQFAAGVFKARRIQLWQVVYSKNGVQDSYYAPR